LQAFLHPKAMHFPTRRFKRGPMGYGRILSAVAMLMTASCSCSDDGVERVDVIPDIVTAVADQQFLMSVRLTDEQGHLMSAEKAAEVRWKPSNGAHLTVSPNQGAQTQATLLGAPTGPITLTASVDGKSGTATITLANPGLGLLTDWATAKHFDNERPTLVLVDGHAPSGWRSDTLIAFVGAGPLDKFRASMVDPGEVTVFSPGHALQRMKVDWSDDCDHVRMTENGAAYPGEITAGCTRPPMEMKLATTTPIHFPVWALIGPIDPGIRLQIHLKNARDKLANGWTGLSLVFDGPAKVLTSAPIVLDVRDESSFACPSVGEYALQVQLDAANVLYGGPGKLTVVYARETLAPTTNGPPVTSSYGGYACRDPVMGTVVVISWDEPAQSILAHELGHAIGPPLGHTKITDGFDDSNVMWAYEYAVPAAREILTLGQAFRLGLDGDAFLPQPVAPPPNPKCTTPPQSVSLDVPCTRLGKDATK